MNTQTETQMMTTPTPTIQMKNPTMTITLIRTFQECTQIIQL